MHLTHSRYAIITLYYFLYSAMVIHMNKKQTRPDKRTRLQEQARIDNLLKSDYYFNNPQSCFKGFSTFTGMSKKSSSILKSNAIENKLINFVQKRINIQNQ